MQGGKLPPPEFSFLLSSWGMEESKSILARNQTLSHEIFLNSTGIYCGQYFKNLNLQS
jgi:hypothetical protein